MESDSSPTLQNQIRPSLPMYPIIQGISTGLVSGLISILYRVSIESADKLFRRIIPYAASGPLYPILWMAMLIGVSILTARLIRFEPMITGGGIAQLENELNGQTRINWFPVLWAKFFAGVLCIFGGLFLGRVGPSVLLGAMAAKGLYSIIKLDDDKKRSWLVCGAAAGLAGAFGAPVSGILFAYEGLSIKPNKRNLLPVLCASFTAFALSRFVFGFKTLFAFNTLRIGSASLIWVCLALGVLLSVIGYFQNRLTAILGGLFDRMEASAPSFFLLIPFILSFIIIFAFPSASQSGIDAIYSAERGQLLIGTLLILAAVKFVFALICISSGAPGGTVFPTLTVGACLGSVVGAVMVSFFGADASVVCVLTVVSMAGYFSAVLRKPLTGIALTAELTAALHLLPLFIIVSLSAAYFPLLIVRLKKQIVEIKPPS